MAKLLTHEECIAIKYDLPYTYRLRANAFDLCVFGTSHTNNPRDPQLSILERELESFKPKEVLLEGNWQTDESKTEKEAIHKGENAYAGFLAKKDNLQVRGWDLTRREELSALESEYSQKTLFAFFVLRNLRQALKFRPETADIERIIRSFKDKSPWKEFDYSFENIKGTYKEIFGEDFDITSLNGAMFRPYGSSKPSVFNSVARRSSVLRDLHCVEIIPMELEKEKRVLAVMGSLHAVMQEPVLREYFKNK